ncbi:MAG: tetraacyldisaccharide 4'-kinase [bacterium]
MKLSDAQWLRFQPLLVPFVPFYRLGVALRNYTYNEGIFKVYRLPVPVISVGNLTVGGTGKTPVTLDLARLLLKAPFKQSPAILSRGYRRKSKGFQWVRDGQGNVSDWTVTGDEPQLYVESIPRIPVAVDSNRVRGGNILIEEAQPSLILLDDAMQHRAIHRDLNIVLHDSHLTWSEAKLLPAGPLREPAQQLERADLLILTNYQSENPLCRETYDQSVELVGAENLITCRPQVTGCRLLRTGERISLKALIDKKLVGFCGIAKPERFAETLEALSAIVPYIIRFDDHHVYSSKDVERLAMTFNQCSADYLITTAKDAVKLGGLFNALTILALDIGIEWLSGFDVLQEKLRNLLNLD